MKNFNTANDVLCQHIFHEACVTQTPRELTNCAICRQPVTQIAQSYRPLKEPAKKLPIIAMMTTIVVICALAGYSLWRE